MKGGGREGYVAVARVTEVGENPSESKPYYAAVADYLSFDSVVSLSNDGIYYENFLNNVPKKQVGFTLQGKSVRTISDKEFVTIILAGLSKNLGNHLGESDSMASEEQARCITELLANRTFRD